VVKTVATASIERCAEATIEDTSLRAFLERLQRVDFRSMVIGWFRKKFAQPMSCTDTRKSIAGLEFLDSGRL